jgi:hypothetical protein
MLELITADPGGREEKGVGLRSLSCWDCGFDSRRSPGCATDRSLVQRSLIDCKCMCVCVTDCDQVQQYLCTYNG